MASMHRKNTERPAKILISAQNSFVLKIGQGRRWVASWRTCNTRTQPKLTKLSGDYVKKLHPLKPLKHVQEH
jgi:hypothetical protein